MSAPPPRASGWTGPLAAGVAHDINNLVQTLSNARAITTAAVTIAPPADADELVDQCLAQLRKLGVRLRTLATAGETDAWARVDHACTDAIAEVDPAGGRVRLGGPSPGGTIVRGSAAAVTTAIASLLEHASAASPAAAPVEMAVRELPDGAASVEIAAPEGGGLGASDRDRLDVLLTTKLRALRGDVSLVLAGAIADAIGGVVHVASGAERGLVLELQLAARAAAPAP
jgi:hypothetical protein